MKVLITNTVPLNGGDEALLRATVESLTARWPAAEVTALCGEAALCRKWLPDLRLASDLEFVTSDAEWRQVTGLYRAADVVLSTPGSIFHDHYAIEDRLRGLEVALDFGKPVVLFAQSVGPFWKPRSLRRVPQVFNRVSRICVRDALSTQHLLDCGVEASRIRETADAAFLWRQLAPELFTAKSDPVRTVGLCFRAWPFGDAVAVKETVAKAEQLCRHLLADAGRELVFLSTCQGVPSYVDDSLIALQVVSRLPPELGARCRVDRTRYGPRELIRALGQCDAFIGMRLHGCILAMLGGTPAMGLGYEPKTQGVFRQLGLEPYQVSFDAAGDDWLRCADRFLADLPEIRAEFPGMLDSLCSRARMNLDVVGELLASRAGQPAPVGSHAGPPGDERQTDAGTPAYFGVLSEEARWQRQVPVLAREIAAVIPAGCRFILVDNGQLGDTVAGGRQAIPFLERGGQYWGAPPDDETAVAELERLRRSGADFVAFAWPAFWWLDHYTGLHRHLLAAYPRVLENDRLIVFDLRPAAGGDGTGANGTGHGGRHGPPAGGRNVYDVIDRVRSEKLTYLEYSALVHLHEAVRGVEQRGVEGVLIEAGCALGGSALVIAASKARARPCYVYDVFGMIPAPSERDGPDGQARYRVIQAGESEGMGGQPYYGYQEGLYEKVKKSFGDYGFPVESNNIHLVKGLYQDTLRVNTPVALAHIDCDWYESVMTCLQRIEPHLADGAVLIVDDYHRWSGCRRAVDEYFADKGARYRFIMKSRLHVVRL